jgi:peptide/nickel transport system ATP-binding protein
MMPDLVPAVEPVLTVKNVSMRYPIKSGPFGRVKGHVDALNDVSLHLAPGEVLGILGESGSGKTTLGRIVMRLMLPTAGDVMFRGKSIVDIDDRDLRAYRREAQMVFQDPYSALNPKMSIRDIVTEPVRIQKRIGAAEVSRLSEELLEVVALPRDYLDRLPTELSGGQRQRVVIARALALQPSLLIADEPVASLDVSIQAQILVLLEKLRRDRNLSMIFISHDISVVRHISDRIVVMYGGRIVETGRAADVISSPIHPYTQMLVASEQNIFDIPFETRVAAGDGSDDRLDACGFRHRCPHVIDDCRKAAPPLIPHGKGRLAACIRKTREVAYEVAD